MDIDFFKQINDNHGHIAGDQALKIVADTLQSGIRESDMLARYGGEEFMIILPGTASTDAFELAENLRALIERTIIEIDSEASVQCTVSIGVAQFDLTINILNELTHRADIALYQAKESGRNKVCLYSHITSK